MLIDLFICQQHKVHSINTHSAQHSSIKTYKT